MAVFELLLVGGLAEGAAERGMEKEGVVSEAVSAAGIVDDAAFDRGAIYTADGVSFDQGNHTHEAGSAIRHAAQLFEEQAIVRRVGCERSGEPGRVDAGGAAERVHLETGVVGEEESRGAASVMAGLLDG